MTIYNPHGTHSKYTEIDRHFAPRSEVYTGADSLITAQRNGWQIVNIVYESQIEMRGGRYTSIYYFKLVRNQQKMVMPIVSNPFIERMLLIENIIVRPYPTRPSAELHDKTTEMAAIRVQNA